MVIAPAPSSPIRLARGLSLVEVMISLAISALLLTAVAAAFRASAAAVENNDEFFRACQSGRVALNLMLTSVRRCNSLDVPSSTRMDMLAADLQDLSFQYDAGTRTLKLINSDTGQQYTLASNVNSLSFTKDTAQGEGGVTYISRVSISLVVEIGNNQIRLTGSAVPRRVQTYAN